MSGREVREYTNLSDPKDRKWGKGKDRIDDEDITFQRMVAKMQEVAGERGGYLHGRGALDSDDLLYLKEQMEAEEDAERLLRRTEKRAFAAFKRAASLADSTPALPLPLRVEPKPKSGIRQQDLLKNVLEIRPKRPRISSSSDGADAAQKSRSSSPSDGVNAVQKAQPSNTASAPSPAPAPNVAKPANLPTKKDSSLAAGVANTQEKPEVGSAGAYLLGLAYESSDEE